MKKRILSLALVLTLCLSLVPTSVVATGQTDSDTTAGDTVDSTIYGPFRVIGEGQVTFDDTDKVLTISGGNVTVAHKLGETSTCEGRIVVAGAGTTVTLNGVNITQSGIAPLTVAGSDVTLKLEGENYLTCTDWEEADQNGYGLYNEEKSRPITIQGEGWLTLAGKKNGTNIDIERTQVGTWTGIINAGGTYIIGGTQTLTQNIVIESGKQLFLNKGLTLDASSGATIFIKCGGTLNNPGITIEKGIIFCEVALESNSLTSSTDRAGYAQALNMELKPKDVENYRPPMDASELEIVLSGGELGSWNYTPETGVFYTISLPGPIVITAEAVEKIYGLEVTAPTFEPITYGDTSAKPITISGTGEGNSDATIQSVTVSGDAFVIDDTGATNKVPKKEASSNTSYTIRPRDGLNVGTYQETITVTYDKGATATAEVSANVTQRPVTVEVGDYKVSKPYDGTVTAAATGAFVTSGIIERDQSTVQVTAVLENYGQAFVHSATKEISLSIEGDPNRNYVLAADKLSVPYEITPVVQNPTVIPTASVMKNKTLDLTKLVSNIQGGADVIFSLENNTDCSLNNGILTSGGTLCDVNVQVSIAAKDAGGDGQYEYAARDDAGTIKVSVVDKSDAGVTLGAIPTTKTYGDPNFSIAATAADPGAGAGVWTWTSSNADVLAVDNSGNVTIMGAGAATITARYESDTTVGQATSGEITVNPSTITVTAANKNIYVGDAIPSLNDPVQGVDYTVTGLVGSDSLDGTLTLTYQKDGNSATPASNTTGTYDIVVSGIAAPNSTNYDGIVLQNGTLTISKRPSSGGSSTRPSTTTTETVKNDDGSTTTTVTNKNNGTIVETTRFQDGTKLEVKTKKDGSVTTTEKRADGVKVETVDEPGKDVTVSVSLPKKVEETVVTIPVKASATTVLMDAKTGEIIKTAVATEDGLTVLLDGSADLIVVDNAKDFDDADHWAEEAIDFVASREIMNGTGDKTFSPDSQLTRGQLAAVLFNFEGQPELEGDHDFTDLPDGHWAEEAVTWAADNGIVSGYGDGVFGLDDPITREQLAVMLWKYAGCPAAKGGLGHFKDAENISDYAVEALEWAVEIGLLSGMGDDTLAPGGDATRGQVAVILMKFCDNQIK